MLKISLITIEIVFGVVHQITIIQSIIVERNLHAYYKLPVAMAGRVRNINGTREFYILQCPQKTTVDIPKPKDMQICVIVGRYQHKNELKDMRANKVRHKSQLHTKVQYKLKKPATNEVSSVKKMIPYMILIRPVKLDAVEGSEIHKRKIPFRLQHSTALTFRDQPAQKFKDQYVANTSNRNIDFKESTEIDTPPSAVSNRTHISSRSTEASTEYDGQDSYEDSAENADSSESSATVLKYLGAKDAISNLIKKKGNKFQNAVSEQQNDNDEAEKFYAEHTKYGKGEKTKGYQNMYHRDEIFNDHIFYDELQQQGHYRNTGS